MVPMMAMQSVCKCECECVCVLIFFLFMLCHSLVWLTSASVKRTCGCRQMYCTLYAHVLQPTTQPGHMNLLFNKVTSSERIYKMNNSNVYLIYTLNGMQFYASRHQNEKTKGTPSALPWLLALLLFSTLCILHEI